LYLTK